MTAEDLEFIGALLARKSLTAVPRGRLARNPGRTIGFPD